MPLAYTNYFKDPMASFVQTFRKSKSEYFLSNKFQKVYVLKALCLRTIYFTWNTRETREQSIRPLGTSDLIDLV